MDVEYPTLPQDVKQRLEMQSKVEGGGPNLEGAALGHEEAAGLGVLAEVDGLQLLLQLAHLLRLGLRHAPQPLKFARHRRIRQQLPRLSPECSYLRLTVSALLDYRHYFGRRKSRIPRDLLQGLQHLVTVLCSAQQACEP